MKLTVMRVLLIAALVATAYGTACEEAAKNPGGWADVGCIYELVAGAVATGWADGDAATYAFILVKHGEPGYWATRFLGATALADTAEGHDQVKTEADITKAGLKAWISSYTKAEVEAGWTAFETAFKAGEIEKPDGSGDKFAAKDATTAVVAAVKEVWGILVGRIAPDSDAAKVYTARISDEDLANSLLIFYIFSEVMSADGAMEFFSSAEGQEWLNNAVKDVDFKTGENTANFLKMTLAVVAAIEAVEEKDWYGEGETELSAENKVKFEAFEKTRKNITAAVTKGKKDANAQAKKETTKDGGTLEKLTTAAQEKAEGKGSESSAAGLFTGVALALSMLML